MKRFALLINGGNAPNEDELPGAINDVIAMKDYLMSPAGGCWLDNEIYTSMPNDRTELIRRKLFEHKNDYCLVYFSGHGYERYLGVPRVILNDGSEVNLRDIEPISKYGIVITDSCRGYCVEDILRKMASTNTNNYCMYDIDYYRNLWDGALRGSIDRNDRPGIVRMLSCSSGEYASETPLPNAHGNYTNVMIKLCQNWFHSGDQSGYLSSLELHNKLKNRMFMSMQHPDYKPINISYPIAVR